MKTVTNNFSEKYSKGTIAIHWISLLLIIVLIPTGFIMSDTEIGPTKLNLLKVHLLVGILVFILTLLRVLFFFKHKRPSKLETGNLIHNKLVIWIENSFYYLLLLLSISGIASVIIGNIGIAIKNSDPTLLPENLDIPSLQAHKIMAIILILLLLGHIGGVVNHYLKIKENTIKRIIP